MSYDFWMETDVGGHRALTLDGMQRLGVQLTASIVCSVFDSDDGLVALDHLTGAAALPLLRRAIGRLHTDPERYRRLGGAMGSLLLDRAVDLLQTMSAWCIKAPRATLRVEA
jgi:hypothetical protein